MTWAYTRELKELRQEVKPGVLGLNKIRTYPKLSGLSVEPSSYTYEIYNPSGTLQTSGTASLTDLGDYAELNAQPSTTLTGTWAYGENYRCEFTWSLSAPSRPGFSVVWFDVVKFPFNHPDLALNDLVEERPDVKEILQRQGELLELSTQIAETMAAIYAVRARVELDALIRHALTELKIAGQSVSSTSVSSSGYTRPNLIVNRERFNLVERKLAMKLIYLSDCGDPEAQTESAGLFRFYREEALNAWRSVGPLQFDLNEDGNIDEVRNEITRSRSQIRRQAGG